MEWKCDTPTQPGFYWFHGNKSEARAHRIEIKLEDDVFKMIDWDMKGWWEPLDKCGYFGQWKGPYGLFSVLHVKQGV